MQRSLLQLFAFVSKGYVPRHSRILLLTVIAECEEDLAQGSAITVEPSRIRIRRLPLVPDV